MSDSKHVREAIASLRINAAKKALEKARLRYQDAVRARDKARVTYEAAWDACRQAGGTRGPRHEAPDAS